MAASTACATPGRLAVQRPSFRHATRRELQRGQQQHRLTVAKASAEAFDHQRAERDLLAAVDSLGYPAAIFPGGEKARAGIDSSIEALEAASPTPAPLRQPERGGAPASKLLGDWQLVYASSGTYVTRSAPAQALLAASRLPGVGVGDIRQSLHLGSGGGGGGSSSSGASSSSGSSTDSSSATGGGQLRTSNTAGFGLGPFGDWEVVVGGIWDVQDGRLARVAFDGFTLQLVGLLGLLKLPSMAKVSVPIDPKTSRKADFYTTYLSDSLRVARGRSRNIFLFRRLP